MGKHAEIRSSGTDMGGDSYVHPRSDKYRDNFDRIFKKKCEGSCGENCCEVTGEECCINGMCD